MKIIVHGKGKIGLSAAKINHSQFPASWQTGTDILNKFQKPVNLPELIVLSVYYFSLRSHDSQLHQKGNGSAFFQ